MEFTLEPGGAGGEDNRTSSDSSEEYTEQARHEEDKEKEKKEKTKVWYRNRLPPDEVEKEWMHNKNRKETIEEENERKLKEKAAKDAVAKDEGTTLERPVFKDDWEEMRYRTMVEAEPEAEARRLKEARARKQCRKASSPCLIGWMVILFVIFSIAAITFVGDYYSTTCNKKFGRNENYFLDNTNFSTTPFTFDDDDRATTIPYWSTTFEDYDEITSDIVFHTRNIEYIEGGSAQDVLRALRG